jgi:HPt (histidine-containing phosphotransfer) domain-containing protein
MDDYLSKPFTQEQLRTVLDHWVPQHLMAAADVDKEDQMQAYRTAAPPPAFAARTPQVVLPAHTPCDAHLDLAALERMRALQQEGAPSVLDRVIEHYLRQSPQLLQTLQKAVAQDDTVTLQQAAHTLKSSSATLGASCLAALCKALEAMGRARDLAQAPAVLSDLETEYHVVRRELTTILQGHTP